MCVLAQEDICGFVFFISLNALPRLKSQFQFQSVNIILLTLMWHQAERIQIPEDLLMWKEISKAIKNGANYCLIILPILFAMQ